MDIEPVNCVRNLGAWFDSMLSMETHINKVCISGFYYLHNLRRVRKYCLATRLSSYSYPCVCHRSAELLQ